MRISPCTTLCLLAMLALLGAMALAACREEEEQHARQPAPTPQTMTKVTQGYAGCLMNSYDGPAFLTKDWQNMTYDIYRPVRCRHHLPDSAGIKTPGDFTRCRDEHTLWVVNEYDITEWPYGLRSVTAATYVEAVCAPDPPE